MSQKQIITTGQGVIVDIQDSDLLHLGWRAYEKQPYPVRSLKRDGVWAAEYLHRVVACRIGLIGAGRVMIDHANGNVLDSRRANLRRVNHAENARNAKIPARNKSGYLGVSFDGRTQKWHAQLMIDGHNRSFGYYATPEEANRARLAAEREHWGIHPRRADAHRLVESR